MAKPYVISALDIGSGSIKLISVLKKPGEDDFEVLGQGQENSLGIIRGVVTDSSKVAKIIASLVEKVENDSGRKIEAVYASVDGGHISSIDSKGLVSVSRADKKISGEDIDRVIQAAKNVPIARNSQILEAYPKEFIVDGVGGVKDPVDMEGIRLEAEVLLLCGFSPFLRSSSQSILDSGIQINELIASPLVSSRAVLTPREKELGACVLDIGSGTTGMSIYREGELVHAKIFGVGSGHITNDIAICLKTDVDTAEKIKIEYGTCKISPSSKKKVKDEKRITLEGEEPLNFSKKMLADIIEARVSDIFDFANKEIKETSNQGQLPAGIILTGGGSKIPGIKELAKKKLKLTCRIGTPSGSSVFQGDPSLSTLCGLVLEASDIEEERGASGPGIGGKIGSFFEKIFRNFIP